MVDVTGKDLLIFLSFWLMQVGQIYGKNCEAWKQVNQEVDNEHNQNQSLMQRSLRVMALINPPFIEFDGRLSGIDMLILQTIAEQLDLHIEFSKTYHSKNLPGTSRRFDKIPPSHILHYFKLYSEKMHFTAKIIV